MRKKLKKWFKECAKKKHSEAQRGELCYCIDDQNGHIYFGKRSDNDNKPIQMPALRINTSDHAVGISDQGSWTSVSMIQYDKFYKKYYDKVIGGNFITNLWDGFMSITQVPRQWISGRHGKAASKGGHVADIATRVFFPVVATATGVYAGAVAACVGAKALKDKIIPTEEELMAMKANDEKYLYYKYTNTIDDNLNNLQEGLIDDWKSGKMRDMSYNQLMRVLDSNREIYKNPPNKIPNKNLNTINNENNIAH